MRRGWFPAWSRRQNFGRAGCGGDGRVEDVDRVRVGDGGDEGNHSEMEDGDDLCCRMAPRGFFLRSATNYRREAGDRTIRRCRLVGEKQIVWCDRTGDLPIAVGRVERITVELRRLGNGLLLPLGRGPVARGHLFRRQERNGELRGSSLRRSPSAVWAPANPVHAPARRQAEKSRPMLADGVRIGIGLLVIASESAGKAAVRLPFPVFHFMLTQP